MEPVSAIGSEGPEAYSHPDAKADIVLVHGLNGNPRDTWASKEKGTFWPSQRLPDSLKSAKVRILVYGYNADVHAFGSIKGGPNMIHQQAQTMLKNLGSQRAREEVEKYPLAFVGFSLGGILVRRALELSRYVHGRKTAAATSDLRSPRHSCAKEGGQDVPQIGNLASAKCRLFPNLQYHEDREWIDGVDVMEMSRARSTISNPDNWNESVHSPLYESISTIESRFLTWMAIASCLVSPWPLALVGLLLIQQYKLAASNVFFQGVHHKSPSMESGHGFSESVKNDRMSVNQRHGARFLMGWLTGLLIPLFIHRSHELGLLLLIAWSMHESREGISQGIFQLTRVLSGILEAVYRHVRLTFAGTQQSSQFVERKSYMMRRHLPTPDVTIQMPAYKEGLSGVIIPTVRSLKAAMMNHELSAESSSISVNNADTSVPESGSMDQAWWFESKISEDHLFELVADAETEEHWSLISWLFSKLVESSSSRLRALQTHIFSRTAGSLQIFGRMSILT